MTDTQKAAVLQAENVRLRVENEQLRALVAEYRAKLASVELTAAQAAAMDGIRTAFGCAPGAEVDQPAILALYAGQLPVKPPCVAAAPKPPEVLR